VENIVTNLYAKFYYDRLRNKKSFRNLKSDNNHKNNNKNNNKNNKLSYCWETVRRESMPRTAEMDVEMTT